MEKNIGIVLDYNEFKEHIAVIRAGDVVETRSSPSFLVVPWRCDGENEKRIQNETKATLRCLLPPINQNNSSSSFQDNITRSLPPLGDQKCFYSGLEPSHWAIFARAY